MKLQRLFQERGLRCTPQRYAVLDYLVHHPEHPTAEEICRAVNRTDPRASRATVYNNLHSLTQAGLVREVVVDGKAVRYDANTGRHHHFICGSCGRVEDIPWFEFPGLKECGVLGERKIHEYELVLRGDCNQCSRDD